MFNRYLFVYGTLRRDFTGKMAAILAKNADYVGQATYQGKLFLIRDYPGVIPSAKSADLVEGDVYHLSNPSLVLAQLDSYEECGSAFPKPHEYLRKLQPLSLANGKALIAWVYLYNRPVTGKQQLKHGDFIALRQR